MHPSEDICVAAARGVREELGEVLNANTIINPLRATVLTSEEIIESPSYPSLRTKYILHTITVEVSGLPEVYAGIVSTSNS
jgi:hypothetical protein